MAQYSRVCALAHLHAEEWTVNIIHAKNPFFKVSKWTCQARNNIAFWIYPVLFSLLSAKGCLRLQELELDRAILINEEIAHAMCLCGLRGLETISFTFTPVSPGAIKELLGKSTLISYLVLIRTLVILTFVLSLLLLLHVNLIWKKGKFFSEFFVCSIIGSCSRLERIEVHIGISDYFMDVEDDASKRKYKYIIKKLTVYENMFNKSRN